MKKIKILFLLIVGVLFIAGCSKEEEEETPSENDYPTVGTIKFYDNVIKLDNQSNISLTQITGTSLTLNETTQVSSIKVNDYLIGSPTTLCPTGLLRKVVSITKNGQSYIFNTQYATLDEVIDECNISEIITNNIFNKTVKSSVSTSFDVLLLDGDANTNTANDQAKITGSLELTPKLIFEMKKKKGERLKSGYIKAGVEFELQKDFDFTCKTSLVNFDKDIPIGKELQGPTFLVGGVIFVTPTLKFSVGMKGGVSANMKIGTHESSTYKIFKELKNGAFTDVQYEKSYLPSSLNLDFTGNASVEVYLKAKYSLKIYEVIGLNVSSKFYLKGDANVSATNLTQVNYCTKWGVKGAAGVEINVFGSDLLTAEIEAQLYEAPLPTILGVNPCDVINLSSIPKDGLVAYYPFNGNANDESGNNNNGTVNGATLTTDRNGNANKAYSFDGVNDYIQVAFNQNLLPNSDTKTYSFWIKYTDNKNAFHFQNGEADYSSGQFKIYLSPINTQVLLHSHHGGGGNSTAEFMTIDNPSNLNNGSFHNVTITINNKKVDYFIDGFLVATKNYTAPYKPFDSNFKIEIGRLYNSFTGGYSQYFKGIVDDIRIYNRVLSSSEIQAIFNN